MPEQDNAAIWTDERQVADWVATSGQRERTRSVHRQVMVDLLPFADDDEFTFVDLGAGTGAASRAVLDHFSSAKAVLADFSPQMMAEGHSALAGFQGRFGYVTMNLETPGWPAELPSSADAVISSLCVHHVPDERKRQLFSEICSHLAPGGWYLNYDPVGATSPVIADAWQRVGDRRDPTAQAARANRTPEQLKRWENHIRYISPLAPQLLWLEEAGFEAVDVYWKDLDNAIFGGRRPL
jgi:tRNA (cmo5U34)-methyltransferase